MQGYGLLQKQQWGWLAQLLMQLPQPCHVPAELFRHDCRGMRLHTLPS